MFKSPRWHMAGDTSDSRLLWVGFDADMLAAEEQTPLFLLPLTPNPAAKPSTQVVAQSASTVRRNATSVSITVLVFISVFASAYRGETPLTGDLVGKDRSLYASSLRMPGSYRRT